MADQAGTDHQSTLIEAQDVQSYFCEQLELATRHQALAIERDTFIYIVQMLLDFNDPKNLFDDTEYGPDLKPLALHYADALEAETVADRNTALRRMGDISLFISGLFPNSLNRKVMDVDYYIAMGGTAYSHVHNSLRVRSASTGALARLFGELSEKFSALVDVLSEVAENSSLTNKTTLLRDYELWVRTGSPRALAKLQRAGLTPAVANISHEHH